ncbi:class IIb bacteriocin, lactobin A/cerein 7B family [Streptococcus sobrinus]|uniref:Class IIb bacteriocin, lactobin A/cerein 7B family n=1 Tax=Streptococcus sobrinus TaxID=1310 RepID=A0ABM6W7Y3_9STRE|nr:class IIb bacteriocin, lactobin A/cerein 7B family [Streptococcus sobrinus]AWN21492.1 class IIb bacteriocin, lactobin A/cerein 7B family [Streptococcus sobrinus]SQG14314.1 class IIb bacteriocin, lactobin A/cerein 7B family [Streptococcus sobrinus]
MKENTAIMNFANATDEELQEINGGILPILATAAVVGICAGAYALSYGAGEAWYNMTH